MIICQRMITCQRMIINIRLSTDEADVTRMQGARL